MAEAAEDDECIRRTIAASGLENEAIDLDRSGKTQEAIKKYEEAEREFAAAVAAALPGHPEDHPKLEQHRREVLERVEYLKGLKGAAPTISVEQQIKAVQLGMAAQATAVDGVAKAGGVKTLAACAAMGAVGGFIVLASIPLVPTSAAVMAGAGGAAYCATRTDKIGDAARGAGGVVVAGAERANELNKEHRITEKLTETGKAGIARAQEVDNKYGISNKLVAGVSAAVSKAKEVEDKHKVTDKVAGGMSFGLSKVSALAKKNSFTSGGYKDTSAAAATVPAASSSTS